MGYKHIYKQFKNLKEDKLVVCKKELLYINHIVTFFKANNAAAYAAHFEPLSTMIDAQLKKIETVSQNLTKIIEQANNKYSIYPFEFLVHMARIEKKIEDILYKINLISNKTTQILEEHFEQYIPHPTLERRYSNKAITHFIDAYINGFYKVESSENGNSEAPNADANISSLINIWGTHNKYRAVNMDKGLKVIENTFWYYELPQLIPALVHEVAHHLFNESNELKNFKEEISEELPEVRFFNNLSDEIVADAIALEHCGISYIYTLFYTQAYKELDHIYYDEQLNTCYYPKPDPMEDPSYRKSFLIFLRLNILIKLYKEMFQEEHESNKDAIEKIETFIGSIYTDTKGNSYSHSLCKHYAETIPQYHKLYEEVYKSYVKLTDAYIFTISKFNGININNEFEKNNFLFKDIFNEIWENSNFHANHWYHPNIFRKKILSKIFNSQDNYAFTPYELTFYKKRTDIESNSHRDIVHNYTNTPFFEKSSEDGTQEDTIATYYTFGIYNFYTNIPKKESLPRDGEDNYSIQKFLTFKQNDNNIAYFTSKVPLTFLDVIGKEKKSDNTFGIIMRLQLSQERKGAIKDGYKDLIQLLTAYKSDAQFKIYKALGPSDFIVISNNIAIETLYKLKSTFSSCVTFKRTFTTISYTDMDNFNDFKLESDFKIKSKLRLYSCNFSINDELKNILPYTKDSNIDDTSGATDIEIEWNSTKYSLKAIMEQINTLENAKIASDIQTFISKKRDL